MIEVPEGSFGKVYEATHKISNFTCAVKVIPKTKIDDRTKRELMKNELEILE